MEKIKFIFAKYKKPILIVGALLVALFIFKKMKKGAKR